MRRPQQIHHEDTDGPDAGGAGLASNVDDVPWLVTDDERVLASAEIASTRSARRNGLMGRDGLEGALVLDPCKWVHTFGMRFPVDIAFLDEDGCVIKTMHMHQRRVGIPVWRASHVIEAEAGAFGRWGLHVGDVVEVRKDDL